jgi:hypothetical protein
MDNQTKDTLNIVGQVMKEELNTVKELINIKTDRLEHSRVRAFALNSSILDYVSNITNRKSVVTTERKSVELPSYFEDMN